MLKIFNVFFIFATLLFTSTLNYQSGILASSAPEFRVSLPLIIKPFFQGILSWNTFINSGSNSYLPLSDGKVVIVSSNKLYIEDQITDEYQYRTQVDCLDSDGNLIWTVYLGKRNLVHYLSPVTKILQLQDGSFIVASRSDEAVANPIRAYSGKSDVHLTRLSPDGVIIWNTFLGGDSWDGFSEIYITFDNEIIVTGGSAASWGDPINAFPNSQSSKSFIAKLNQEGHLKWNMFLNETWLSELTQIFLTSNNFLLVASTDCLCFAKLSQNGNLITTTNLSDIGVSDLRITFKPDGSLIFIGHVSRSWGTPRRLYTSSQDAIVGYVNSEGNLMWHTYLGAAISYDYVNSVTYTSDGDILVTGRSSKSWGKPINRLNDGADIYVARLNSNGELVWNTFLGSDRQDHADLIYFSKDNKIIVTGNSEKSWGQPRISHSGGDDRFIVMLNANGEVLWNTFIHSSRYLARPALFLPDDTILISTIATKNWGMPQRPHSGFSYRSEDILLAGFNHNGDLMWNTFLGGDNFDMAIEVTVPSDSLFVFGRSSSSWGDPRQAYGPQKDLFIAKLHIKN